MKKKFLTGLYILIAVCLVTFGCARITEQRKIIFEQEQALNAPIEIPATGIVKFQEIQDNGKPTLVLFYVDWCTYCKNFMPVFGELSEIYKDKFNFAVVNCDYPENQKLKEEFSIFSYPSLYIADKQLDFNFNINHSATTDNNIMQKELEKYYKLRERVLK